MTLPLRRARRRRNLGVTDLAAQAARIAPEVELGWNNLLDELHEAGWPTRQPEGDQQPGGGHICDTHCDQPCFDVSLTLDYADPTGEQAGHLAALHGDLLALQDHLHIVTTLLAAMHRIANRHRPTLSPAIPGCIVANCDQPVESRSTTTGCSYVGMEQVCGHWVAKPGATPTCRRHRARRERDVAA
jgi:hypothetical protein